MKLKLIITAILCLAIGYGASYLIKPKCCIGEKATVTVSDTITLRANPVSWFEISVDSMARAVKFYETILDTKLLDLGAPNSMMFFPGNPDGKGATGALCYDPTMFKPSKDGALIYFNSNAVDLAVELTRVEKAGGVIITPKTFISDEGGYYSIILDSEGNRVALYSKL